MALRVLLLAENPYVGGITSHLIGVLEAFRDDPDIEVIPATFPGWHPDFTFPELAAARGFTVHTFPMAWRFDARVLSAFRRFLREQQIDLVHTHGYRGAVVGALAAGSVPVISTCHGELVAPALRSRIWERLTLRAMRRHPRVIACADYVRDWLIAEGLSADKVVTVYNSARQPSGGRAPDLDVPPQALKALFVGRLVGGKGVDDLLRAAVDIPDMVTIIVGDGPLRKTLEGLARSLAVDARFVGRTDNPAPYYELADVVVLPSQLEALPMVLIEAAACGKPAIATRVGGIPEVVEDGVTGLLVEPGDPKQLREVLMQCREEALRIRLGAAARERWQAHFAPEVMAAGIRRVYLEAAKSP